MDSELEQEMCRLYESGLTQNKIAEAVKFSQATVSHVLARNGIKARIGRGDRSSHWKGGRRIDCDGYVNLWMSENDPYAGMMRRRDNYVLEHRVVMARSLSRPLGRHETVHHINGDRADNRIENLQLRSGQHGKGVVHRCLACGSTNVVTEKLQ